MIKPSLVSVEREFLPAALEITSTPPSPLPRTITLTICIFAMLALLGAALGRIDIVAVAAGKIVTRARTQVVQASETAVVKRIMVEPGQFVKQNEDLIQIDTENIQAEMEHAQQDLIQSRIDETRLRAFINQSETDEFESLADIDPLQLERGRIQLLVQRLEKTSRISAMERDIANKISELETINIMLRKAQNVFPLVEARAGIRAKAAELEYGSKLLSLDAQQQVVEITAEIDLQKEKLSGIKSMIAGLEYQKQQSEAEFIKTAYNELARALAQKSSATENLAKAKRRFDLATIRAPLGGVITQLNIRTVGGVVSSAQQLVSITPNGSPLEVEVVLPNREAGFVREGQEVQVKVDAYPFTRYGLLKGEVISVAQDAEPQSNPNEYITMGSQRKADQSANIEGSERLLYTVRVRIDPDSLLLDGRPVSLIPGMAVRAEIKTGSRTILEFLMAPLAEYMQQSMRER